MFQDVYPQRGGGRTRQLAVPARPILVVAPPPQPAYRSRQTVITDVVVAGHSDEPVTAIVETVTTEVTVRPETMVIRDVVAPSMFTAVPEEERGANDMADTKSAKEAPLSEVISVAHATRSRPRRDQVFAMAKWGVLAIVIGFAGYVSIDGYLTNQELKRRLEGLPAAAASNDATPEDRQAAEGTDETELPKDAVAKYAVAADMPRIIRIPKIKVTARVLQMGVNPDGSMQAPVGIFDAGWYNGSARPGTQGAAVIDAHASGPTREGLFAYLNTLVVGDAVEIERGDGSKVSYKVVAKETVARDAVDMRKFMTVYGGANEGLNMITCDGSWVKDQRTFSDRTIVYTEKV